MSEKKKKKEKEVFVPKPVYLVGEKEPLTGADAQRYRHNKSTYKIKKFLKGTIPEALENELIERDLEFIRNVVLKNKNKKEDESGESK